MSAEMPPGLDAELMDAADLLPGEKVDIVDITNGHRLSTYLIEGPRGSGVVGINGAAAHLIHPGDLVILIAYGMFDTAEAKVFEPRVVFVDERNAITDIGNLFGALEFATTCAEAGVQPIIGCEIALLSNGGARNGRASNGNGHAALSINRGHHDTGWNFGRLQTPE